MRLNGLAMLLLAASAAAIVPIAAANAQPLQSSELKARTGDGRFEFRGRTLVWSFTPDGKVTSDYTTSRMELGGIGETFGLKDSGTWRRDGDRLCITWQSSQGSENCYTVAQGQGRMVTLMGPQMIEGTLESSAGTGHSDTPAGPSNPVAREQPKVRVPRIPGAR